MSGTMTKAERQELRGVVRNQFKVLREEVAQRQTELVAEAQKRLLERYETTDRVRSEVQSQIAEMVSEVGDEVIKLIEKNIDATGPVAFLQRIDVPRINWATEEKAQLQRVLGTGIQEQVSDALLRLKRQEADLLRMLAVDALETEGARAFLAAIPTVAELVPSERLRELEEQFDKGNAGDDSIPPRL